MAGGRTFQQSLDALAPFGRMVTYGMAGREMPAALAPTTLLGTSRGVLGFWFGHMRAQPERIDKAMRELITMVDADPSSHPARRHPGG
jgi:NADPH2:quinone reductase